MNGATTIQERLKDLRLNKRLKLEELAEQTGISKSALGSYEKEDFKEINHGNLITLADFYGVSVDYLLCRTENREQINTPLTELHLNDEMVALLKSGRINNRLLCELATHKDLSLIHISIADTSGDFKRLYGCTFAENRPETIHENGRKHNMPRMSKKRKHELSFYLNDRGRVTYNELCRKDVYKRQVPTKWNGCSVAITFITGQKKLFCMR